MARVIMVLVLLFTAAPAAFSDEAVPIEAEFPHKIVYTSDAAFDQQILIKDCEERRGVFNECGSVCDDRQEGMTCVTVCAFTCELDGK